MNIGSAKVDSITRETIKHHLIDVVDVTQPFNVRDYCQLALKAIQVNIIIIKCNDLFVRIRILYQEGKYLL